jgi:hypothetical protein
MTSEKQHANSILTTNKMPNLQSGAKYKVAAAPEYHAWLLYASKWCLFGEQETPTRGASWYGSVDSIPNQLRQCTSKKDSYYRNDAPYTYNRRSNSIGASYKE